MVRRVGVGLTLLLGEALSVPPSVPPLLLIVGCVAAPPCRLPSLCASVIGLKSLLHPLSFSGSCSQASPSPSFRPLRPRACLLISVSAYPAPLPAVGSSCENDTTKRAHRGVNIMSLPHRPWQCQREHRRERRKASTGTVGPDTVTPYRSPGSA